ncbi:MAG: Gfo/Idh/MocA family oxidoreductase [Ruminococcaceae bacterium]|nr:Gfo/Idh/MocA family oxidoreductase [Oscillospiraceae bacterium]
MKKIRFAVAGVGKRGYSLIKTVLSIGDVEIVAVCDLYPDRVDMAKERVVEISGTAPNGYTDYRKMFAEEKLDAVFVSSAWESHVEIAVAAMEAGVAVSMEVGGAYSIHDCWAMVRTYERTRTPIMLMENCCFNKFELLSTALVRSGKLGTIVHCHGAYGHDLRDEILGGNVNRHYRLRNYMNRNCDNYPTHELGPIAKILNINRGNQMLSLVSVASKSAGLNDFSKTEANPDKSLVGAEFKQGDIVNTIITCAGGETISLKLDTTLPKYYSREFTVRGTKGLANMEAEMIAIDGECNTHEFWENCKNAAKYDEYLPDVWKNMTDEQIAAGHGGMDYIEFKEFFAALREGREMPIDVYDAAAWMSITALSEASIACGGAPQPIPDFTSGKWLLREPRDVIKF